MGVTSILKDFKSNHGMAHNADQKDNYTTAAKQNYSLQFTVEGSRLKINNRTFEMHIW